MTESIYLIITNIYITLTCSSATTQGTQKEVKFAASLKSCFCKFLLGLGQTEVASRLNNTVKDFRLIETIKIDLKLWMFWLNFSLIIFVFWQKIFVCSLNFSLLMCFCEFHNPYINLTIVSCLSICLFICLYVCQSHFPPFHIYQNPYWINTKPNIKEYI